MFGAYLAGVDKLLLCDGQAVGVRKDHSGIVLLDSILQTPVARQDCTVRLDIPLSEVTRGRDGTGPGRTAPSGSTSRSQR